MAIPTEQGRTAADEVQIRLLRGAGIAGRAARARTLSATVISLARRAIRERHPDWSELEVMLEFVRTHYGSDLADRIRARLLPPGR